MAMIAGTYWVARGSKSGRTTPSASQSSFIAAMNLLRESADRLAVLRGAPDDLVVDVGDVAHVRDAKPAVPQVA